MLDEKSCAIEAPNVAAGKIVSPKVASEPLIPAAIMQSRPNPITIRSYGLAAGIKRQCPFEKPFGGQCQRGNGEQGIAKCRHKKAARLQIGPARRDQRSPTSRLKDPR
jgi:hypothetical protein